MKIRIIVRITVKVTVIIRMISIIAYDKINAIDKNDK